MLTGKNTALLADLEEMAKAWPGRLFPQGFTRQVERLMACADLVVLNKSKTPPFEPEGQTLPNEELRLKYRFIDLRRPELTRAMIMRHKMTKATRDYFDSLGFLEVERPRGGAFGRLRQNRRR